MRFVVRMRVCQQDVEVGWEDGQLFGHPHRVRTVKKLAEALDGRAIGIPPGPYTKTASQHLANAWSTRYLIMDLYGMCVTSEEGDWLDLPPLPEDAAR